MSDSSNELFSVAGYIVNEKLHESGSSLVYRARRSKDELPAIVKMLKDAFPSSERIAWFRREFETTQALGELDGVIRCHELRTEQHRWYMALEDFGAQSLTQLIRNGYFQSRDFVDIAIKIAAALAEIHGHHVIHKDINPSNIVLNPETGVLKIIDFGISSSLSRESPSLRTPNQLEGTLAYISPEQTGRMNRSLDYRSDLYSLGITLYQLATGQLPFQASEAVELVHAHIAREPVPPCEVAPYVDETMSRIIMKLMCKNAEERYQSARGLQRDLENYQQQRRTGQPLGSFSLGQTDVSGHFHIPQKLYGRAEERGQLLAAFDRVVSGTGELLLVSGPPGIGKSALVKEIYKPLTERRGYVVSGKFDQLQRDVPYEPVVQAFRRLVRLLLTEEEESISEWKQRLTIALAPNAQILVDVVPELELIIGPQPTVPELGPQEAQNRFDLAFRHFIAVFTKPEHPLVLFIDDLQWADGGSLRLLESLMARPNNEHLLIICAYRDNDARTARASDAWIGRLDRHGLVFHTIALQTLTQTHIQQLLVDTICLEREKITGLATLVHGKTGGNPFFIGEFLRSLYTEKLIYFDLNTFQWNFDIERIKTSEMTDNVVTLMAQKIEKLPPASLHVLKLGACIGNTFDLRTLATVSEENSRHVADALWSALEGGLIIPMDEAYKLTEVDVEGLLDGLSVSYRFAHDRIQQAAYSLIDDDQKRPVHWTVGHLLLSSAAGEEGGHHLFDIVNHLNQGLIYATSQKKRDNLAQLNLQAGRRALTSAAYESALRYLRVGLALVTTSDPSAVMDPKKIKLDVLLSSPGDVRAAWERMYELSLALFENAAAASYLNGAHGNMHQLVGVVYSHAHTLLDKIESYKIEIQSYAARDLLQEGVNLGLQVLGYLGVEIPSSPDEEDTEKGAVMAMEAWRGHEIDEFAELPHMEDAEMLAAMEIMARLYIPAFNGSPGVFAMVVFHQVRISISHGLTSSASRGFMGYGLLLCAYGEFKSGYEFGKLALSVSERFAGADKASLLFMFNFFIRHWGESVAETIEPLLENYEISLDSGDLEYAGLSLAGYAAQAFWASEELPIIAEATAQHYDAIQLIKQAQAGETSSVYRQTVLNLLDTHESPCEFTGPACDERTKLPFYIETKNITELAILFTSKLTLCYLFAEYERGLEYAREVRNNAAGIPSTMILVGYTFYEALTLAALYPTFNHEDRIEALVRLEHDLQQLRAWTEHAPANFEHKWLLVTAERARILGQAQEAQDFYDRAISAAQTYTYLNEEALAHELAARFHREHGYAHLARNYLRDAHYAYRRWGARVKVAQLEDHYSQELVFTTSYRSGGGAAERSSTTTTGRGDMSEDLTTVIRASRAMRDEDDLEVLLRRVMEISLKNAGAERGFLILKRAERLIIKIKGFIGEHKSMESLSVDIDESDELSYGIVQYVVRTSEPVMLDHAYKEGLFVKDPYIRNNQCKSVLCMPVMNQGMLIAIVFMTNDRVAGAFTDDRVEILNLLLAPAAVSIENALLKELERHGGFQYAVGGSLAATSESYVTREADRDLLLGIRRGGYCYVLNARQMGKSSLRIRTMKRLEREGTHCVSIDLSAIGGSEPRQWYAGIAQVISRDAGLSRGEFRRWWKANDHIAPVTCLCELIEHEILPRVQKNIVIFIDEVDSVLSLSFNVDDFFALVRYFFNKRAEEPVYERLTFVLLGVVSPSDLIKDSRRTPFNIVGQSISLKGFRPSEVRPLMTGLRGKSKQPDVILKTVLTQTGGQPFLTQKVCKILKDADTNPLPGKERIWVEKWVKHKVIDNWEAQDEPEHLRTIANRILASEERAPALLRLYRDVLDPQEVVLADGSSLQTEALLSGLVVNDHGVLRVRNFIYERVFDASWVAEKLESS